MGLPGNRSQAYELCRIRFHENWKGFQCVKFSITKRWQGPKGCYLDIFFYFKHTSFPLKYRSPGEHQDLHIGSNKLKLKNTRHGVECAQPKCEHVLLGGWLANLCSKYLSFMHCHKAPPRKKFLGLKISFWEVGSSLSHLEFWVSIFCPSHTESAEVAREPWVASPHC